MSTKRASVAQGAANRWPTVALGVRGWFASWWAPLLSAVGACAISAASLTSHTRFHLAGVRLSMYWPLLSLGAAAFIAGAGITARQKLHLERELRSARAAAERREAAETAVFAEMSEELRELLTWLSLNSFGRASVFLCRNNTHLVLVGRYSPNPTYRRSSGRDNYPIDQGIIGTAWREGEAEERSLPDPGREPLPSSRWLARQRKMGVPPELAQTLTMRSRSYAAVRIDDRSRSLGVLVVESDRTAESSDPDTGGRFGITLTALRALANSPELHRLVRLLDAVVDIPDDDINHIVTKDLRQR